jgi:hypothetical protein
VVVNEFVIVLEIVVTVVVVLVEVVNGVGVGVEVELAVVVFADVEVVAEDEDKVVKIVSVDFVVEICRPEVDVVMVASVAVCFSVGDFFCN